MSISWDRVKQAVGARYRRSVLAQYGTGLGCDCGDCPAGPTDVDIPAPRRQQAVDAPRETVAR